MSDRIRRQLEKAIVYIEQHLENKITVAQVADYACISLYHFHRIFSAYTGETASQYILHRRLELAATKISTQKSMAIEEIALNSGFETHSAFSRTFKKHFKLSPRKFRHDPSLAKQSCDKTRPFLNTAAPKNKVIEVSIEEQATLWFNYKITEVIDETAMESSDFQENIMQIATDFNGFLDIGKPHLFGVATSRNDGYSARSKNIADMLASFWHGGIYTKKGDDDWSDNWCEIEAGLWAVCTHKGNFEYSSQTWNNLLRSWLSESGYELRDTVSFERYLMSPLVVKNSDEWLTQIYLPIKKA